MHDDGVGSWPARRRRMSPDKVALIHNDRDITYAELDDRVTVLAHGLRDAGVRPGDRVAYLGRNSSAFVEALFATARIGAVFCPLNSRLAAPELAYILGDCQPRVLLREPSFAELVTAAGTDIDEVEIDSQSAWAWAALGNTFLEAPSSHGTAANITIDHRVALDDLFMIQYTSGTSGRPKGVRLTHANVTWNVYNLLIDVDLGYDEVALVTAPMFHTAALNQVLLPTFLKGGTTLIEAQFDPSRVLELVSKHRITFLFGVTSMFVALSEAAEWSTTDLSCLRSALGGGAPIPESLLRRYHDRGLQIIQGYGLTEASPGVSMLRAGESFKKVGSVGTPCFFADVRIADATSAPVDAGSAGEVLVQGPNVTSGYWRQPEASQEAITADGWLRTGDVAREDADGFLWIVDRVKDMYISGGENVYPAEVERVIYEHPAVAECAVFGLPDPRWGEVGCALVTLREPHQDTAEDLLRWIEGRIARYKIPKSITIVDELPHNASGKLARPLLRALVAPPVVPGAESAGDVTVTATPTSRKGGNST